MKISKFLNRQTIERVAILLSTIYPYSPYEIKNVILKIDSIDYTFLVLEESLKANLSLDEAIYLRLKGKDEL